MIDTQTFPMLEFHSFPNADPGGPPKGGPPRPEREADPLTMKETVEYRIPGMMMIFRSTVDNSGHFIANLYHEHGSGVNIESVTPAETLDPVEAVC